MMNDERETMNDELWKFFAEQKTEIIIIEMQCL